MQKFKQFFKKMRRPGSGFLAVLLSLSFVSSCMSGCSAKKAESTVSAETNKKIKKDEDSGTKGVVRKKKPKKEIAAGVINVDFKPDFNSSGKVYTPLNIEAKSQEYTINPDLSNIANLNQFGNLSQKQKELIAKNGFAVAPTNSEQLFYIYEDNTYKKIPGFVTSDSVLQLYHILFDYSLRNVETEYFYNDLAALNNNITGELIRAYSEVQNEKVKENIGVMIGYFSVCNLCLGQEIPQGCPENIAEIAREELSRIEAASAPQASLLLKSGIDYSLFKPRGHYTRSEQLQKFFRAMSWYGIASMPFYKDNKKEKGRDEDSAQRAIIATMALCKLDNTQGVDLWENIYSTTSFFVGESDDINPYEVSLAVKEAYGGMPSYDEIPERMDEFYDEVDKMRSSEIGMDSGEESAPKMCFMGQRYLPDSFIFQKLSDTGERLIPSGVDVFAAFGSERADELLDEIYLKGKSVPKYKKVLEGLKKMFKSYDISQETHNAYTTWLYTLKSLTVPFSKGYPLFMQNKAWEDKSLATALGSWAEMRHDTILYGKQSSVECGGDEPPEVIGYVEPNPEFFNRLLWLTSYTKENLESRGILSEAMKYKYENVEEMLTFMKNCAVKELNGEDLSYEETQTILTYGGSLEYISSSIAEADNWHLIENDTDKNMAVIADVHSVSYGSGYEYLEAAVGHAAEMYVAVPYKGKVFLTRGAVFDYFEFTSQERMTDEQWQEKLKASAPQRPPFVDSFMEQIIGDEVPTPASPFSSGC